MRDGKRETIDGVRGSATLTSGWWTGLGLVCLVLTATVVLHAQDQQPSPSSVTFKTLVNINGAVGGNPASTLAQGTEGDLYGTTEYYGLNLGGSVFKMTSSASLTALYSFCAQSNCVDGSGPNSLVLDPSGKFYGTAVTGGANGGGTFFEITPSGDLTTLYNFCAPTNCNDGKGPNGIVLGADGSFYGTTNAGGNAGGGTVFKITPAGTLTTLYTFCSLPNCTDGASPTATVIQASNGDLYGTAQLGGAYSFGTVFKISANGVLKTLHNFCAQPNCTDGSMPQAPLVQGSSGNLYGSAGGGLYGSGVVFRIALTGAFTTLYDFCAQANCTDGAGLYSGLIQATDGNFYGTTSFGGANDNCLVYSGYPAGCGTVFKMTPGGTLTTLHNFDGIDGQGLFQNPLLQRTNGTFYGPTNGGGSSGAACLGKFSNGCGTVFSLSVGLGPFVETLPTSGKVGAKVKILGNNLTGATSVTFNGVAATFTVVSASEITATVPTGATTGKVEVVTPTRTLKSNVKFQVRP